MVGVAQLVRVSDCGSDGRGFESRHPPHFLKQDATANQNFGLHNRMQFKELGECRFSMEFKKSLSCLRGVTGHESKPILSCKSPVPVMPEQGLFIVVAHS